MRTAARLLPPLALMVLIFVLSARPNLGTGLGVWDTILRKGAHMTAFGSLWFLWWRGFGYRRIWLAVAVSVAYAISDEVHQHFVAGRHGTPLDVGIDAAGIAIAMLIALRCRATSPTPPGREFPPA